MKYKLYKMSFQTAVHFGNGTLESGEYTIGSDTLFSALCQEALKVDAVLFEELCESVFSDQLRFSDALPYIGDIYYLPKPMMKIEKEQREASSILKKAYKKLKYISIDSFNEYLKGDYDILKEQDLENLGKYVVKTAAAIRGNEETEPYRIGQYYFNEGNGLYIIVGYEKDEVIRMFEELLDSLSYSGIGGKRSSGFGRFSATVKKVPQHLEERLESSASRYMTISLSLPKESELEEAMNGAEYIVCKRSGFVASETYASEQMRKKDLYVFKSGACFLNRFTGDVYDVSSKAGKHPVYRYAKPLFVGVDVCSKI